MAAENTLAPFPNCPALDGCHCQTSSLARIFHYYGHPLSEDMLLGLGAGLGFMYWHQKGTPPFVGGRGNVKNFFTALGHRVGVTITVTTTASRKKAESALLTMLGRQEPVMLYGDMGFLPWFDFPEDYHFGGHTFVISGYDGADTVLASDIDHKATGTKKGFYYPLTLDQLHQARSSKFKPFPPKSGWLEFDFNGWQPPGKSVIYDAIRQNAAEMLNPPISNFGVRGIRRTAREITRWPKLFTEPELRLNLFMLYVFIEIGGTGGGCFRYMYARFLEEAARLTKNKDLEEAASGFQQSGEQFSRLAGFFVDAETAPEPGTRIKQANKTLLAIARREEALYQQLREL